jgi:hypothetical protein
MEPDELKESPHSHLNYVAQRDSNVATAHQCSTNLLPQLESRAELHETIARNDWSEGERIEAEISSRGISQ